jgi:hypothetical protein
VHVWLEVVWSEFSGSSWFFAGGKYTPGAKARFVASRERPKAEALDYLEAKAATTAKNNVNSSGKDNGKSNGNDKSRSSAFGEG